MSVAVTLILPAQPAAGDGAVFTPFGGDGKTAPLGMYDVGFEIVGDGSGGTATCTLAMDERYTSMVCLANPYIAGDAAAGDFTLFIFDTTLGAPNIRVLGVIPFVGFGTRNGSYMWYPPPMFLSGSGRLMFQAPNVGVGETYGLSACVYVFDRNVRQLSPISLLNMSRVGLNAPIAQS